jgi:hypothetical protein
MSIRAALFVLVDPKRKYIAAYSGVVANVDQDYATLVIRFSRAVKFHPILSRRSRIASISSLSVPFIIRGTCKRI